MKPKIVPKFLYRYRALGRPRIGADDPDEIEAVTFQRAALYFPSRTQFNDPFDCMMPDMSHISDNEFHKLMVNRAREEFLELPEDKREGFAEEMHNLGRAQIEQLLQAFVDDLGVLSLSSKPDNAPMWAYYANNSKGMCLEFETRDQFFRTVHPMKYASKAPRYVLDAHSDNAEAFVLCKERRWRSEEEWRLIGPKAKELYPFKPESLTGVIFGASCAGPDMDKVRTWVAEGPCIPKFYTAIARKAYKIEIVLM
jgi:hypothetical protein